eukprot:TRINITY_DN830_c0_g1_i1.p1 TRINITY_DN830_c0_g1~~TRINITY_DN830_c0_g1_i1.p1  ORF type:complete len:630 (-),score=166.92 TRINITY_DN830_c0_g1_i1:148-2037(-)
MKKALKRAVRRLSSSTRRGYHRQCNTLTEALLGLHNGSLKCETLMQDCIARSKTASPLRAFVCTADSTKLIEQARAADQRRAIGKMKGPLDGVPIAIKDNFCTRDLPTTCASRMLHGFQASYDATVCAKLRSAGAIIIGKTNLDEFAMGSTTSNGFYGASINPWSPSLVTNKKDAPSSCSCGLDHHNTIGTNTTTQQNSMSADDPKKEAHCCGGSSGGSAVAVSTRCCYGALGSDTGGSVRLPSAFCGVVGLKPSYGRISRWGLIEFASSLDTVGILSQAVEDSRILLEILEGRDEKDSTSLPISSFHRRSSVSSSSLSSASASASSSSSQPSCSLSSSSSLKGVRIGIPKEYNVEELSEEIRSCWSRAIDWLIERGATVVPVSLPHTALSLPTYYVLAPAEAASNFARYDGLRYGFSSFSTTPSSSSSSSSASSSSFSNHASSSLTPELSLSSSASSSSSSSSSCSAAASSLLSIYARNRSPGFGAEVKRRILIGNFVLSSQSYHEYVHKAHCVRRAVAQDFDSCFRDQNVDALLTPTATGSAMSFRSIRNSSASSGPISEYLNDIMTIPANLAGLPAVSVPVGLCSAGLPLGLQLIGRPLDDHHLLDIACILEQSAHFSNLPPFYTS